MIDTKEKKETQAEPTSSKGTLEIKPKGKEKNLTEKKGLDMKDFNGQNTGGKELSGFNMSEFNTPEEEIEVTEKVITSISVEKPHKQ